MLMPRQCRNRRMPALLRSITVALAVAMMSTIAHGQAANESSFGRSFGIEATGGIIGSAAGAGLGIAISGVTRCPADDDVICVFERLGVAAAIATASSAAGTYYAGKMGDTRPSAPGAIIGSLAGVAAGLGVLRLIDETDSRLGEVGSGIVFAVSHGIVTALGSRIGAAIRH